MSGRFTFVAAGVEAVVRLGYAAAVESTGGVVSTAVAAFATAASSAGDADGVSDPAASPGAASEDSDRVAAPGCPSSCDAAGAASVTAGDVTVLGGGSITAG